MPQKISQFDILKDVLRCVEQGVSMNAEAHHLAIQWAVSEIERAWGEFHKENAAAIRLNLQLVDLRDALERIASIEAIDRYGTNASLIAREAIEALERFLARHKAQNDKPQHEAGA